MRCEEVIEELAAPTDTRDAASLADHFPVVRRVPPGPSVPLSSTVFGRRPRPPTRPPRLGQPLGNVASSLDVSVSKEVTSPLCSFPPMDRPWPARRERLHARPRRSALVCGKRSEWLAWRGRRRLVAGLRGGFSSTSFLSTARLPLWRPSSPFSPRTRFRSRLFAQRGNRGRSSGCDPGRS